MRHVVVVADSRYPIREPFAGGMQAMTWHLVRALRSRGVTVSAYAAPGSDPALGSSLLTTRPLELSPAARRDVSMQPVEWLEQHHAYLGLLLELARRDDVDVVHNNTLHYLPVAMAEALPTRMVTTLHTPPTPWLEPAIRLGDGRGSRFVAVSEHTARQWRHVAEAAVVPNGVDLGLWPAGRGGDDLFWAGRMVPEKAPHLAIDIARAAGRRLRLAGPVCDPVYWERRVVPRLAGRDDVEYLGHLRQTEIAAAVGSSAVCLVTPLWEEPYGLVAAEALACGTPVVGFARGGLCEVVDETSGRLVPGQDVSAAAQVVDEAARLFRDDVRRRAEVHCSVDSMVDRYLEIYSESMNRVAT
jgi:glycosyltransferase involved in cell wall biosynthesis